MHALNQLSIRTELVHRAADKIRCLRLCAQTRICIHQVTGIQHNTDVFALNALKEKLHLARIRQA